MRVNPPAYVLGEAFERAAATHPSRTALAATAHGPQLSYAELERSSRALALRWRATGCEAGDRVGVWWPKCPEAVVALVAALRLGAIYVPLDAAAPSARIAALAADAGCRWLVADPRRAAQARDWATVPPHLCSELDPWTDAASEPGPLAPAERISDDGAYILYTSGTTGVPKGVLLSHAHALQFIRWAGAQVELAPGDQVSSHAPFHFDLSIFDLWASLTAGATVHLLDPESARFPAAVADWIVREAITVWYSVPSALVALGPLVREVARGCLRHIVFAGEVFPPAALDAWRRALPSTAFANWYGPTETNVCTGLDLGRWADHPVPAPDPLPIGEACPNFELRVGDDPSRPVADGVEGDLWARGPGILLGYWGAVERPQWYNTGDRVVRTPDRGYLYRGRRDHLIKCRGYRISLLEIESALQALPAVSQAVVIAVPSPSHAQTLAAYVTAASAVVPEAAQLRQHLSERLPHYMIPEYLIIAPAFPLTPSGKLDRQQLAALPLPVAA